MNIKISKLLKYFSKSIFYEIYFKGIYGKIMLFFLFPFLFNTEPQRLFIFLIIGFLAMFIYFPSDKNDNKAYNFIRSLFIFWGLGLSFIHIDFSDISFHKPITGMIITIIFFLIIIPISSYLLKKFNKLKFLPYLILFYLAIGLGISNYLYTGII